MSRSRSALRSARARRDPTPEAWSVALVGACSAMIFVKTVFWASLACLVWTHVAYPAFVAGLARLRPKRVDDAAIEPTVSIIIAAYNEETVIGRRIENLLAL